MAQPGPAYVADVRGWNAWILLSVEMLSAVIFLLYLYTRRRAEEMLRQSEAHYRLISENTADVIWILDLESQNFTYVSPSVQKLRGYTPHEVMQQTMDQTLTPASLTKVLTLLAERPPSIGSPPHTDELDQICKDGSIITTEVTTNYVLNNARKMQVVGVSRDITVRKQAEMRLNNLNRTYALLSAINQTIVRVREPNKLFEESCRIAVSQGEFRMAWIGLLDPQTKRVIPVARAGEVGTYVDNLRIVLDDSERGHGPTATALLTGQPIVVNDIDTDPRMAPWRTDALRLGYRASAVFPLTVTGRLYGTLNLYASEPHFFDEDEIKLFAEMAMDIMFALEFIEQEQQRQRSEAALKESEIRYQVIFEGASEGIIAMRIADHSFQYINPAMCNLFGYTYNEFIHLAIVDLHPHEALPRVLAEFAALERGDKVIAISIPCCHKDGNIFYADVKATSTRLNDEEFLVGFFSDITERRHAEEALIEERNLLARRVDERTADLSRANTDLIRAVRAKDEFLANMSHELRTPLNAILALSEGLLEQLRGPLNERQQASLRNIETSGRHLLALINDILDLSKVESGRMELQYDVFMIADVCEASLLFVKEQAIKKHLQLGLQLSDRLAKVNADPKRLKQMLVNLLSNAVKFTPKDGRVNLDVTIDTEMEVIRFTVEDTGIGMSPEGMARLFQPFIQLDSSLSRQHDGTGLGLALVRRLAELHGGSVSVESEIGKGSRFVIALPYPPPELVDAKSPSSAFPFKGSTTLHSAVVIEDSETAGEQLARYLQELRIHAIVHPKGEGALEQVVSIHPDVIFLDLQMPGQSGWDVLAQLKADPRLQTIPVIIVSVVDDRARGLAAGAAEYLVKPISRETLRHALGIVVAGPEVAREALIIAAQTTISPLNVRILLVEDNEVNIIAIGDYLHDRGYCVVIARNGREALDVIAEARPDIILMDIQMPEMDGLEATRRLRGIPDYKTTPIIALTALAMPGDRERCIAAGVTEYLTKPVSLKGLVDIIQRLLTA
ncbi:MAG: response regulator [Chloroflexales bacterium]